MTKLFLGQIGPVQSFIAQARRTQDLQVGSLMLSDLAAMGIHTASQIDGFESIFPFVDGDQIPEQVPHRFAFLCETDVYEVAQAVETAIRKRWFDNFARPVFELIDSAIGPGEWSKVFERQAENWLTFNWVAVTYDASDHKGSFARVNRAMAQRKHFRHFAQVNEPGTKCTLTGSQSALFDFRNYRENWNKVRQHINDPNQIVIRPNENLGTLATIKRLAQTVGSFEAYEHQRFASTDEIAANDSHVEEGKSLAKYIAVLHMDGDRMGQYLSELGSLVEHQKFSAQLSRYASKLVPEIVQEFGGNTGTLVYAGGDDILALLPAKFALPCAIELRNRFYDLTGRTASAGISISPANLPLDTAIEAARQAESTAKDTYGRDAIVITESHGTGQIRSAGIKWHDIPLILRFQEHFNSGRLSARLGYDLLSLIQDMGGIVPPEARSAEVKRLTKRRLSEAAKPSEREAIMQDTEQLIEIAENLKINDLLSGWNVIARMLIIARFIGQDHEMEARV